MVARVTRKVTPELVEELKPKLMLVRLETREDDHLVTCWDDVKEMINRVSDIIAQHHHDDYEPLREIRIGDINTKYDLFHAILFDWRNIRNVVYLHGYHPLYGERDICKGVYEFVLVDQNCAKWYNIIMQYVKSFYIGNISVKWVDL